MFRMTRTLVGLLLFGTALIAQEVPGGDTPSDAPPQEETGCQALDYNTDSENTSWACSYETSKFEITVDFQTPTNGSCPPGKCHFPGATITVKNITGTDKEIKGGSGSGSGAPDTGNPPQGGTDDLRYGSPRTIGRGASTSFDFLDRDVTCGDHYVCDISYASGCPTGSPHGWGDCSIFNLFFVCTACPEDDTPDDAGGMIAF